MLVLVLSFMCGIAGIIAAQLQADFKRIECQRNPDLYDVGTLAIKKFNRSTYVLNGEFELKIDLDNTYEFKIEVSKSQAGSNYVSYPMKAPRARLCDYMNNMYQVYQFDDRGGQSKIPQITTGDNDCLLEKNRFYFNNFLLKANYFPPMFPNGNYRLNFILLPEEKSILCCSIYVTISHPVTVTRYHY